MWASYLAFNKTSLQQAPAVIRNEWVMSERAVPTVLTPVLERYGFDVRRIEREGTAAEKALGQPPAAVQTAQAAIHAYEDRVCGVASPTAAAVLFAADGSSRPTARRWSDVLAEFDYDIRRIWLDGTPEDRAVFTFSHPDVVEHDARLTAYEEQVCTA